MNRSESARQLQRCRPASQKKRNVKYTPQTKSNVPTLPDIYKSPSAYESDNDAEMNDRVDTELEYNPNMFLKKTGKPETISIFSKESNTEFDEIIKSTSFLKLPEKRPPEIN
jgi:hypothetical protein